MAFVQENMIGFLVKIQICVGNILSQIFVQEAGRINFKTTGIDH